MIVSDKFFVGYSDINSEKKLSNAAVLRYFEDIAGMHGNLAGENILYSDTTWILTSYHVIVKNRPTYGEKVDVRTWAHEMKGVCSYREYEIAGEDGGCAAIALSGWAHINLKEKKLEKVSEELALAYDCEDEKTNFPEVKNARLTAPLEHISEREFYVDRNFIDTNGHMNNVFYLDIAELMLPEDVYSAGECDEFEIAFKKEIKYGEHIKGFYSEDDFARFVTIKGADVGDVRAIIKLYK